MNLDLALVAVVEESADEIKVGAAATKAVEKQRRLCERSALGRADATTFERPLGG